MHTIGAPRFATDWPGITLERGGGVGFQVKVEQIGQGVSFIIWVCDHWQRLMMADNDWSWLVNVWFMTMNDHYQQCFEQFNSQTLGVTVPAVSSVPISWVIARQWFLLFLLVIPNISRFTMNYWSFRRIMTGHVLTIDYVVLPMVLPVGQSVNSESIKKSIGKTIHQ